MGDEELVRKKLILLSLFSILSACTSTVFGNDINCQKDGSISALYSTIKSDKGLYLAISTDSENEVANQVYSSLLSKLMIIDGLTHLYEIDWAKNTIRPDEYANPATIDALCVGNVFLEKYHSIGSKKYELVGGYEDMYELSMSYQPLYKKLLEEDQQLAKKAGMESIDSFDCLALMEE